MDTSQGASASLRLAYVATGAAAPAPLVAIIVLNDPMTVLVIGLLLVAAFSLCSVAQGRLQTVAAAVSAAAWISLTAFAVASLPDPGPMLRAIFAAVASITILVNFLMLGRRVRAADGKTA